VPTEDHLYRGNDDEVAGRPDPAADRNLVRHVLYLGGRGRATPYLSITADRDEAAFFGLVWQTSSAALASSGTKHLQNDALIAALKRNKGRSRWPSTKDRLRAAKYAEEHGEELADFVAFEDGPTALAATRSAFQRSR
jgi:hypothetical protein